MSDCNPINKATCHANGDFHILEEPLVSKCVSSFCGFFIFIAIIRQINPKKTNDKIQKKNNKHNTHTYSLAKGILKPEAVVRKVRIPVRYKLVIITTFCRDFSLITPGKSTLNTAMPSPINKVPGKRKKITD